MSVVRREKSKLFTPLALADGTLTLKHRIAMAPLTRKRSPNHVPTELVGQYYEQRASDGGLLISEGTLISPMVPPPRSPGLVRCYVRYALCCVGYYSMYVHG